jgi:hypothetical protein
VARHLFGTRSNKSKSIHQIKKSKDSLDHQRLTSANQSIEGGGDTFNSVNAAEKVSTISPNYSELRTIKEATTQDRLELCALSLGS